MIRVLMTADPLGGVFGYSVDLARALAAHGVRTALATLGGALSRPQREEALSVPGLTLHPSTFRLEWMDDPWDDLGRAGRWLSALARSIRPDVVHLGGYAHAALDLGAPKVVVGHSCVLSWWRAVYGEEAPPRWDRYRQAVREGLAAADRVVAPTEAFLGELELRYGPLRDARVVPNGIGGSPAPTAADPLVLGAGRLWDQAKNFSILDAAAERISWPVELAGDPRHPDGRTFSARRCTLLGSLSRAALAARMGRAAILCHPARYEPFGLVPLEAASRGCALVLGDLPTLREIWGDAAVYVEATDPGEVAGAVQALIDDPPRRARLGGAARARALRLGLDVQAQVMLAVYGELIGRQAGAR